MKNALGFLLFVFFFAAGAAALAADSPLRVNMILPDGRALIYAGSKDGMKKSMTYEVQRDGKTIATLEITETLDYASYAEIKDKTGEVKELDALVLVATTTKEEKKKDEDKKEKAEKKKEKEEEEEKPEKKEAEEKPKKSEEKTAKKEEKPAGPAIKKGVEYEYPSHYGTTGVMLMPSAHKLPRGRVAVALSHVSLERVDNASGTSLLDSSQNSVGISYGLDDSLELSYYHATDESISLSGAVPASSKDVDAYMLKYAFGKRYLYKGNSVKNVRYAAELARYIIEDGNDMTRITGLFSYHHANFASHFGVYKLSGREVLGRDTGLMVGLEAPMADNRLSLIGQFDLFRKENFYAGGARYRYEKWGTVEAGLLGLNSDKAFMLSLSHMF